MAAEIDEDAKVALPVEPGHSCAPSAHWCSSSFWQFAKSKQSIPCTEFDAKEALAEMAEDEIPAVEVDSDEAYRE